MDPLTPEFFEEIFQEYDIQLDKGILNQKIEENLTKKLKDNIQCKAILGFDLYRYSQYKLLQQSIIPYFLHGIIMSTISHCVRLEPFLFQFLDRDDILSNFIDMGDGGFLIFDTPLEAIIFATYFQANVKRYNSIIPESKTMRQVLGQVNLRYCITYDDIYAFNNNHYGSGIINNARILSKDKLNRFLFDKNSTQWFDVNINGIENLLTIEFEHFQNIEIFNTYQVAEEGELNSIIFEEGYAKILTLDVLHIGEYKV